MTHFHVFNDKDGKVRHVPFTAAEEAKIVAEEQRLANLPKPKTIEDELNEIKARLDALEGAGV